MFYFSREQHKLQVMKQLLHTYLLFLFLIVFTSNFGYAQTAEYMEIDNIVVIEAENLSEADAWIIDNASPDHSGSGYIYWPNSGTMNDPGDGLIEILIEINDPGTYILEWRTQVGMGNSNTDHNDSWLKFPDASAFYAAKDNGSIVYPHDSGQFPNPDGAGADGWFKVYRYGGADWTWNTGTNDHDAHDIHVEFDTPGVYTMQISGRSTYHFIDRIVLYKDGHPDPLDPDLPETPAGSTSLADQASSNNTLVAYPIPIDLQVNPILNISGLESGTYSVQVFDFFGRMAFVDQTLVPVDGASIVLPNLSPGMYIIRFVNTETQQMYTGRIKVD